MKANELMIRDWVLYHEKPCQILGIKEDDDSVYRCLITGPEEFNWWFKIADFQPIPLTPEILEKNEFECRGAWCLPGEDLGMRQDGDSWGLLSHYFDYYALAFCHIEYVHELQHALRLCGIEKTIEL